MPMSSDQIAALCSQQQQGLGGALQNLLVGSIYSPQSPLGLQAIQNLGPAALSALVSPQTPILGALTQGAMGRSMAMQSIGQLTFPGGNGPLGMGFGTGQREQIYQYMRNQQTLPQATMGELSQIVGAGAQMGSFTAVHSVQQFKRQFDELLQAVKTVTSTLGVALTDAANMLQQVHSYGFSGQAGATFMTNLQAAAYSGGVSPQAMMQVMGNIAPMMRQAGGVRVGQGMNASMSAVGTMATGYEMGIINDQSLLTATGQAGGAGLQSLAASVLSNSAYRMRHTGRGSYISAAMLNPETGGVDEEMLESLRTGVMGPGMMRQEGNRRSHRYGQANWVANRNKIAGQVSEQEPFAELMFYRNYLNQKGVGLDSSMGKIMLSRLSGMSMDEAEGITPLLQNLDQIRATQAVREAGLRLESQRSAKRSEAGGPEWLKNFQDKLKKFMGKLDEAGANVQRSLEDLMTEQFNKSIDYVESFMSPEILKMQGTPGGRAQVEAWRKTAMGFAGKGSTANVRSLGGPGVGAQGNEALALQSLTLGGSPLSQVLSSSGRIGGMGLAESDALRNLAGQSASGLGALWNNEFGKTPFANGVPQELLQKLQSEDRRGAAGDRWGSSTARRKANILLGNQDVLGTSVISTESTSAFEQAHRAYAAVAPLMGMNGSRTIGGLPQMAVNEALAPLQQSTGKFGGQDYSVALNDEMKQAIQSGDYIKYKRLVERAGAEQVLMGSKGSGIFANIQSYGTFMDQAKKFGLGKIDPNTTSGARAAMNAMAAKSGMRPEQFNAFVQSSQGVLGKLGAASEKGYNYHAVFLQALKEMTGTPGANSRSVFIKALEDKFPSMTDREMEDMADNAGFSSSGSGIDGTKVAGALFALSAAGPAGALMTTMASADVMKELFTSGWDSKLTDKINKTPGLEGIGSILDEMSHSTNPESIAKLYDSVISSNDPKAVAKKLGTLRTALEAGGVDTKGLAMMESGANFGGKLVGSKVRGRLGRVEEAIIQASGGIVSKSDFGKTTGEAEQKISDILQRSVGEVSGFVSGKRGGDQWTGKEIMTDFTKLTTQVAQANQTQKDEAKKQSEADQQAAGEQMAKGINRVGLNVNVVSIPATTGGGGGNGGEGASPVGGGNPNIFSSYVQSGGT